MANPTTVILKGNPLLKEALVTDAAIVPGYLVVPTATGVRPHNTEGVAVPFKVATEGISGLHGGTLDTSHAVGVVVQYATCNHGDEVYALLHAGENASAINTMLASEGNGRLRVVAGDDVAIARALEVVNATSAESRIRVEVL